MLKPSKPYSESHEDGTFVALRLRPAGPDDSLLLFNYRNDAQVVENSLTGRAVAWEDHQRWFNARREDPECRLFIAENPDGETVGQIRLDITAGIGTITYSVASEWRGRGYGSALIAAIEPLAGELGVRRLTAIVRLENRPSRQIFVMQGYESVTCEQGLRFIKELEAPMHGKEGKMIPYGRQSITEEDIQAVAKVLRSDYLTTGPAVETFEERLCSYLGVRHAVAISNGTAALHAACHAAGIGPGDEVITTPMTFAASANAVLYCGGTPVFADIDPQTWNIDPASVREKITSRTKAIIPVHYTGLPCDMDAILDIAKEYGLKIIEDGAHALGAEYKGAPIGCHGDMMTLSFHPVKHITTGEGGAIVTNDDALAAALRRFRTHGIVRGAQMTAHQDEPWFYEQQELGFNYRITDFQCALGTSQMDRLPDFLKRRREIAASYDEAFTGLEGISLPGRLSVARSAWHLYVIRLELEKLTAGRREVFLALRDQGLGVNVHYIPVYYHPYYQELGYEKGLCPVSEDLYERIITLPLYQGMTDEAVNCVIKTVKETIGRFLRAS